MFAATACCNTQAQTADIQAELRVKVYDSLLISPYPLPHPRPQFSLFPSEDGAPHVAILQVSKLIYAEAALVLYGKNTFSTSNHNSFSSLCTFGGADQPLSPWAPHKHSNPCPHTMCTPSPDMQARLTQDVSKIFTPYRKDLPKWLFGTPYLRNPRTRHEVKSSRNPGYSFAAFLRQIGPHNACGIRSLRISCNGHKDHMYQIHYEIPLYSAIIRRFLCNVHDLVLGRFTSQLPCTRRAICFSPCYTPPPIALLTI